MNPIQSWLTIPAGGTFDLRTPANQSLFKFTADGALQIGDAVTLQQIVDGGALHTWMLPVPTQPDGIRANVSQFTISYAGGDGNVNLFGVVMAKDNGGNLTTAMNFQVGRLSFQSGALGWSFDDDGLRCGGTLVLPAAGITPYTPPTTYKGRVTLQVGSGMATATIAADLCGPSHAGLSSSYVAFASYVTSNSLAGTVPYMTFTYDPDTGLTTITFNGDSTEEVCYKIEPI
jgi:hypothetical protein